MKLLYLKLIILFLIAIFPVASFNYFIDPYGFFNNSSLNLWYEPGYEPNQHYAKIRHLIKDEHAWDSYLFGASRVGKINPDLIPNGNYYNMNYSEGLPGEHLVDIKVLLKKRIPVKNVMIGLDNFFYRITPEEHDVQIMRQPYFESDTKRLFYEIKYLFSAPRISLIKHRKSQKNVFLTNFNIMGNGMQKLEKVDENIEKNIDQHLKNERFRKANIIPTEYRSEDNYNELIEKTIQYIIEIIKLSKRHHFNLYLFINPTHKSYYMQSNPDNFLLFKEKLAQITSYWDFSGFNSITTNNYYWYETSHYRLIVGDFIVCRMTDCIENKVPEDFGVFVTKENVYDHIKMQKTRLVANTM